MTTLEPGLGVHGITSLRISSPEFPSLGNDSFLDQALLMPVTGLAPPQA